LRAVYLIPSSPASLGAKIEVLNASWRYATDLLATLSDDRRLQTADSLKSLLGLLARVHGSCTALAQAVVKPRTVTGPECPPDLKLQLENFIRLTAPVGLEARSRRIEAELSDSHPCGLCRSLSQF
jgi:hypothetical protein